MRELHRNGAMTDRRPGTPTKRFSAIAAALDIPGQAIIDGEVVVIHEGRTDFSELQAELAAGRQNRLVYYAFDLIWRNGEATSKIA
jgi:bifunctional non-homologous end joining protein LigD